MCRVQEPVVDRAGPCLNLNSSTGYRQDLDPILEATGEVSVGGSGGNFRSRRNNIVDLLAE